MREQLLDEGGALRRLVDDLLRARQPDPAPVEDLRAPQRDRVAAVRLVRREHRVSARRRGARAQAGSLTDQPFVKPLVAV